MRAVRSPSRPLDRSRAGEGDPETVLGEEIATGLREIDPATGRVVGLEYWHASAALPRELLTLLPPPGVAGVA